MVLCANKPLESLRLPLSVSRQYSVSIPVLHPDKKTGEAHDVKMDISRDPTRLFMHTGFGASEVDGTRVTINIPFEGNSELFHVKPRATILIRRAAKSSVTRSCVTSRR